MRRTLSRRPAVTAALVLALAGLLAACDRTKAPTPTPPTPTTTASAPAQPR
jgi:hypothetical protein